MQIDPRFTQKTLQKSPGKSRGIAWKDKDVEELIELMKEETIMFRLENAKTPEKRAVYKSLQVQLQNKGNIQLVDNMFTVKQAVPPAFSILL